jgi:hypothetical protein
VNVRALPAWTEPRFPEASQETGSARVEWAARLVILYGVALLIVLVVAIGTSSTSGVVQPGHDQMNPVSHSDYELHRSIGHVP